MATEKPLRIAVLISGGGTTLKNLIAVRKNERLLADIAWVISSNPEAKGLLFANEDSIPTSVIERNTFESVENFSDAIFATCTAAEVDLVVMGGFLKRVTIPSAYENKVINIHPSLIPAFSGKGFYGARVHKAVIDYGCKVSGCTVHFVDDQYDHGPIIAQKSLAVAKDESPNTLASRVFELECQLYPEAINLIARGMVSVSGRKVSIH